MINDRNMGFYILSKQIKPNPNPVYSTELNFSKHSIRSKISSELEQDP